LRGTVVDRAGPVRRGLIVRIAHSASFFRGSIDRVKSVLLRQIDGVPEQVSDTNDQVLVDVIP
jgi:hypothetical protein